MSDGVAETNMTEQQAMQLEADTEMGALDVSEHVADEAQEMAQEMPSDGQALEDELNRSKSYSFFDKNRRRGLCCQVPGCDRTLHKLKGYYKRYKICPYHCSLDHLIVDGVAVRWCQQCGRFQLLEEFDADRRSCRAKLSKHNERRRKLVQSPAAEYDARPLRPPSLRRAKRNSGFASHDLNDMAQDLSEEKCKAASSSHDVLGHAARTCFNVPPPVVQTQLEKPFSTSTNSAFRPVSAPTTAQLHPDLVLSLQELISRQGGATSRHVQQTGLNKGAAAAARFAAGTGDTLRRLLGGSGLLSEGFQNNNRHMRPEIPMGSGTAGPSPEASFMAVDDQAIMELCRCAEAQLQQSAPYDPGFWQPPSSSAPHNRSLLPGSFASADAAGAGAMESGMLLAASSQSSAECVRPEGTSNASPLSHLDGAAKAKTNPGPGPHFAAAPSAAALIAHVDRTVAQQLLTVLSQAHVASQQALLPQQDVFTVSVKLFGMTPDQLPAHIVTQLQQWMISAPSYFEVAARPGCVHLTCSALATRQELELFQGDLQHPLHDLAARWQHASLNATFAIQIAGNERAAVVSRNTAAVMQLDLSTGAADGLAHTGTSAPLGAPVPQIAVVRPLAATPDFDGDFLLMGSRLRASDRIHCVSHSGHPIVEVLTLGPLFVSGLTAATSTPISTSTVSVLGGRGADGTGGNGTPNDGAAAAAAAADDALNRGGRDCIVEEDGIGISAGFAKVRLPELEQGSYRLEAQRGVFVSSPAAFVVLEDAAAVQEVRQLEAHPTWVSNVPAFLTKLGMVARMSAVLTASNGDATAAGLAMKADAQALHRFVSAAQDIAAVALQRGWPEVLRMSLPVASIQCDNDSGSASSHDLAAPGIDSGGAAAQAMHAIASILGAGGKTALSPLLVGVLSGSPAIINVLASWAKQHGCDLTPLHSVSAFKPSPVSSPLHLHDAPASSASAEPSVALSLFHIVATLEDDVGVRMAKALMDPRLGFSAEAWAEGGPGRSAFSVAMALKKKSLLELLVAHGVPCAAETLAAMHKAADTSTMLARGRNSSNGNSNDDCTVPAMGTKPHELDGVLVGGSGVQQVLAGGKGVGDDDALPSLFAPDGAMKPIPFLHGENCASSSSLAPGVPRPPSTPISAAKLTEAFAEIQGVHETVVCSELNGDHHVLMIASCLCQVLLAAIFLWMVRMHRAAVLVFAAPLLMLALPRLTQAFRLEKHSQGCRMLNGSCLVVATSLVLLVGGGVSWAFS